MAGVGREPSEGEEDMGTDGKDAGTGGRQTTVFGDVFQGSHAGGTTIQVGDVGDDSPIWAGTWGVLITESPDILRGDSQRDEWIGSGITQHWIQKWRRQGLRRWDHMY